MKKTKGLIAVAVAVAAVAIVLAVVWKTVGGDLDVVGTQSVASFDAVLNITGAQPDETNRWSLSAPDGSARFIWSGNSAGITFDAQPFLDAGLDPAKLPENYVYAGNQLTVFRTLGDDQPADEATPRAAYEEIVEKYRAAIGYHHQLDHYGMMLGDGNMFEWAKDLSTLTTTGENQDKDIVFVLNPEPLIAAGVDPENVAGWAYAQVAVEQDGKSVDALKLLKPVNLNEAGT